MGSLDKVKKLPIEERLRKLKAYSDEKESEINEVRRLLEAGKDELQQQQELAEQVPIPQMAATNDALTTPEERAMFHIHRQDRIQQNMIEGQAQQKEEEEVDTLEETIDRQQGSRFVPESTARFTQEIATAATRPIHEFYSEITQITSQAEQSGYLTSQQMARVEYINTIAERKEHADYKPSGSSARELHLVHTLREKLQGIYRLQRDNTENIEHGYTFAHKDNERYVSK